jgi:CRISPR/Cas system CMR-associated protein Cmr5 small subunit
MIPWIIQEVTNQDYKVQISFSISSKVEEIDKIDFLSIMRKSLEKLSSYYSLSSLFEIDASSVQSYFRIKNETSLTEKSSKETISEEDLVLEMLEHDFIAHMPPKRRYTIELEVKKISRGKPRVVEPDEF